MKILGIETHAVTPKGYRTSAVDWWRILNPLNHLKDHYDIKTINKIVPRNVRSDSDSIVEKHYLKKLKGFDVVYSSYISAPKAYAWLRAAATHYGQKLIVDMDDNLFKVDSKNPASLVYEKGSDTLFYTHQILNDADIVSTTTEHLKNELRLEGREKPIWVIPNYIDPEVFKMDWSTRKEPTPKKITIAYQGSTTHYTDMNESGFLEAMNQIIKEYGKRVKFKFIGMTLDDLEDKIERKNRSRIKYIYGKRDFYEWVDLWRKRDG